MGFGPVFLSALPIVPLALWKGRNAGEKRKAELILIFCLLSYVLWFLEASQRGRHLLPAAAAFSLLAAVAFERFKEQGVFPRALGGAVLALGLGFGGVFNAGYNKQFVPVVLGAQSEEAFLTEKLWYFRDLMWINRHLGKETRLFPMVNPVHLYLDVDYIPTSVHLYGFLDWTQFGDAEGLHRRLRKEGFTHVFFDAAIFDGVTKGDSSVRRLEGRVGRLLRDLVTRYGELMYQDNRVVRSFRSLDGPKKIVRPVIYRLVGAT